MDSGSIIAHQFEIKDVVLNDFLILWCIYSFWIIPLSECHLYKALLTIYKKRTIAVDMHASQTKIALDCIDALLLSVQIISDSVKGWIIWGP